MNDMFRDWTRFAAVLSLVVACGSDDTTTPSNSNPVVPDESDASPGIASLEVRPLETDLGDVLCSKPDLYYDQLPPSVTHRGTSHEIFEVENTGTVRVSFRYSYDSVGEDPIAWYFDLIGCIFTGYDDEAHMHICRLEPGHSARLEAYPQTYCHMDNKDTGLQFTIDAYTIEGFTPVTITAMGKTLLYHGEIDTHEFVFSQQDFSSPNLPVWDIPCHGYVGRAYIPFKLTNATRLPAGTHFLMCGGTGFRSYSCDGYPYGQDIFTIALPNENGKHALVQPGESVDGCVLIPESAPTSMGVFEGELYTTGLGQPLSVISQWGEGSVVKVPVRVVAP